MVVIDASVLVDALLALATANRLSLRRHPSRSLWTRAWELRTNLSATTP
jgi:predicted nucleic acid-binding protein